MKLNKPNFWDKKQITLISIILLPITIIYYLLFQLNKFIKSIFKKKFKNVKVICVGNIYLGGTGKTPLVIEIFKEIKKKNNVSVLKKNNHKYLDEINLLRKNSNLICTNDRSEGVQKSADKGDKFIILDDGFQDYSIIKDYSILCINSDIGFGNKMLLPSGPLRESISNIKNFNSAVINGKKNTNLEAELKKYNNKIKIFYSEYKLINFEKFIGKDILAFSGIANNYKFFNLLKNNLNVKKTISYPDHYNYSEDELINIIKLAKEKNMIITTTSKDFNRISDFKEEIECVEVELYIDNRESLINSIIND